MGVADGRGNGLGFDGFEPRLLLAQKGFDRLSPNGEGEAELERGARAEKREPEREWESPADKGTGLGLTGLN